MSTADINEIAGLNREQLATLITLFVELEGRVDLIKEEFNCIAEVKLKLEHIQQLRVKYKDKIDELKAVYDQDGTRNPIARRQFRLRMSMQIFRRSMRVLKRRAFKVGQDTEGAEYEVCEDGDHKTALDALDFAEKVCQWAEEFELEREKVALQRAKYELELAKFNEQKESHIDDHDLKEREFEFKQADYKLRKAEYELSKMRKGLADVQDNSEFGRKKAQKQATDPIDHIISSEVGDDGVETRLVRGVLNRGF